MPNDKDIVGQPGPTRTLYGARGVCGTNSIHERHHSVLGGLQLVYRYRINSKRIQV
eukprot:XP_001707018.1 Hypothetical protein GL50803_36283 [Giardia lamblia ATCC 50803]